jgi:hypothetical protein
MGAIKKPFCRGTAIIPPHARACQVFFEIFSQFFAYFFMKSDNSTRAPPKIRLPQATSFVRSTTSLAALPPHHLRAAQHI